MGGHNSLQKMTDLTPIQLIKLLGLVPVPCSSLGAAEKQRGWEAPTLQPSRKLTAGNQPENPPGLGAWQLLKQQTPKALFADLPATPLSSEAWLWTARFRTTHTPGDRLQWKTRATQSHPQGLGAAGRGAGGWLSIRRKPASARYARVLLKRMHCHFTGHW